MKSLKDELRVAVVTTHPPSMGTLNEYGFHFVIVIPDGNFMWMVTKGKVNVPLLGKFSEGQDDFFNEFHKIIINRAIIKIIFWLI